MAADDPLAELLDLSEDVTAAVIFDREGAVAAATVGNEQARAAADAAGGMLAYAGALRQGPSVERVEAVTPEGGVYVLREGERAIVATTGPDPAGPLVLHDLRECLRKSGSRPKRSRRAS